MSEASDGELEADTTAAVPTPAVVALAGWAVPGLGYWLIGHRARGMTVCVTVAGLFVAGLLIGGVRVLEVPTFNRLGGRVAVSTGESYLQYVLRDVGAKPWSVPQVMAGPLAIAGDVASVYATEALPAAEALPDRTQRGSESHSRLNEIAVLYTAVAGMLNVLAMIDSAHRAGKLAEAK